MHSILFVCFGNICRSPAAESIFLDQVKKMNRDLSNKIHVESCGISSINEGRSPDYRMTLAAKKRGVELTGKSRGITIGDFERFDWIFVATEVLLESLKGMSPPHHKNKIYLMTHFSKNYSGVDVPDPYYTGEKGFEKVMTILQDACIGIKKHLNNLGASDEKI